MFGVRLYSFKNIVFWTYTFIVFGIQFNTLSAQNLSADRKTKEVPSYFLKDKANELGIEDILKDEYTFAPFTNKSMDDLNASYWIRIDFKDELDTLTTQKIWRLRTAVFSEATLYYMTENTLKQKAFGQFDGNEKDSSFFYPNGFPFQKQNLISGRYLYVKAQMHFKTTYTLPFRYLSNDSNRFYTTYYTVQEVKKIIPSILYFGACSILFLTFIVVYLNIKKTEFLFYSLYVFFSAIYLSAANIPSLRFLSESKIGFWTVLVSQILINLFYLLFSKLYLNTSKHYPLLNIIINIVVIILVLLILSHGFTYFSGFYIEQGSILNFQRGLMTLFGLFSMTYLLYKAKDILVTFIVAGSFIYMIGALGYLFTFNKYYMMGGSTIEIFIFSLGLAYKIKLGYEDKLTLQKEISMKEISIKRAQMNPHFIFNSLNSIQHLILNNNKVSALSYLSKFGKLTRNILESSHMATATLKEEINLLKSYLELEALRFDNSFNYSITIDDELDIESVEIPLMLIQPFVENSLIHGLIGKKVGKKNISLRFLNNDDHYIVEIEDNGIGRHSKTTIFRNEEHKSRGMGITKKRLEMLDIDNKNRNSIEIVDKYDSDNQPSGTKIIIRIHNPLK
ncbi:sensor histidine kinase [Allomuricauda sp. F6463D]|uniref:sensor histidine kinase n=1 Tax=Allomuricauda sp. F6463D TaxID=2926409 RepID=UPI001FF571DC|nr:histidine kinase [Muricauda sp. F6463D]MCK0160877.1 histidine kinase [Muricauda sp. F6463D]